MPTVQEVFTPYKFPTFTYVDRSEHGFEEQIQESLSIPNVIISLSGPSKSGKTVLLRKVVPKDYIIEINGASISSGDDLWDLVLKWMESPSETTDVSASGSEFKLSGRAGGEAGIPLVAKGKAELGAEGGYKSSAEVRVVRRYGGLPQVVKEIADSEYVVFIDDFHYIPRDIQSDIGRQIKAAAESGVRICTASVPHRSDDVVRSNTELHGRVRSINLDYWTIDELTTIASKGFGVLNAKVIPEHINKMAVEAFGSPQLMQILCLNYCFVANIKDAFPAISDVNLENDGMRKVFKKASAFSDFSSLIDVLHAGPKPRGQERNRFNFVDGSRGDVYRSILLAIMQDPGSLTFTYDDLLHRVRQQCSDDEKPTGSSISNALEQINDLVDDFSKKNENAQKGKILEWDEHTLDVVEPYFMFFLRHSQILNAKKQ